VEKLGKKGLLSKIKRSVASSLSPAKPFPFKLSSPPPLSLLLDFS
jgi:hypothetical protein